MRQDRPMPPPNGERPLRGEKGSRRPERSLEEIAFTRWLTPENAVFSVKNNLLYLSLCENGETAEPIRVLLYRQFPFSLLWEYISVMNEEEQEVGILRSLDLFEGESREMLQTELARRYYAPVIQKILSVKERYGFSYWRVVTEEGELRFTLKDTFRSIYHPDDRRVIFSDVDGNRFEIPDVSALDTNSRRKLELYL